MKHISIYFSCIQEGSSDEKNIVDAKLAIVFTGVFDTDTIKRSQIGWPSIIFKIRKIHQNPDQI